MFIALYFGKNYRKHIYVCPCFYRAVRSYLICCLDVWMGNTLVYSATFNDLGMFMSVLSMLARHPSQIVFMLSLTNYRVLAILCFEFAQHLICTPIADLVSQDRDVATFMSGA